LLANHVYEAWIQCPSPTHNLSGGKVPNMITTQHQQAMINNITNKGGVNTWYEILEMVAIHDDK